MINLLNIPENELNQTTILMQRELKKRDWTAEILYIGSSLIFIKRKEGKEIRIFSATPPSTTYSAGYLANDKFATYKILESINIRQLQSIVCDVNTKDETITEFIKKHQKIVIKPIDGGHGKGVTVNVTSLEMAKIAINIAIANNKSSNKVIVQKQYPHDDIFDLRLLYINYEYVGAIHRVPARIYGNGKNTVKELVEKENLETRRGEPYKATLAMISVLEVENYMGEQINSIPSIGETVSVLGVANYGAGGETIDVTEDIPKWLIDEATVIAKSMQLPVAGVDYLLAQKPNSNSNNEQLDAIVIEVNKCPSLAIHDLPTHGTPRMAVARYFDYLAQL